ncbi:MAG: PCYCGC motif-containing (lipo)protein, partial [Candidatus Kryptoniota bacterium]
PLLAFFSTILIAWIGRVQTDLDLYPLAQLPAEVQSAPLTVKMAYQFAAANPDLMKQVPCYCGCGDIGHTSNFDCYVSAVDDQGNITFDHHALGCSICVDITQDVMRLTQQGKSPQEIRAVIDTTYSKYGPSNIP